MLNPDAKEQSEKLIYILGKIRLILGSFFQVLSLGIVSASLGANLETFQLMPETGGGRCSNVLSSYTVFPHFKVNLGLSCGSENFSSHSHYSTEQIFLSLRF